MTRRISTLLILSLLVVAFVAIQVDAAQQAPVKQRVNNLMIDRAMQYALPYADESVWDNADKGGQVLGLASPSGSRAAGNSPGIIIGETTYDYQHNGTMGRMVDWGYDDSLGFIIHFTWMRMDGFTFGGRSYAYDAWSADVADQKYTDEASQKLFSGTQYGGYVGIDVTQFTDTLIGDTANCAILGGHMHEGGGLYASQFHFDFTPAFGFWGAKARVPDSVQYWGQGYPWPNPDSGATIWPKFRYQEVPMNTPVLHVLAQESWLAAHTDPSGLRYFRKVGHRQAGDWDYPPRILDSINVLSQDVAASNITGRVALVWLARVCDDLDVCDTCPNHDQIGLLTEQSDNDLYYQLSDDFGLTWDKRVNATKGVLETDGYRPYAHVSALFTSDDVFHVAWDNRVWRADTYQTGVTDRCRMVHWGEGLGTTVGDDGHERVNHRTAANLEWEQTECTGGAWQMNGSKLSISECDSNLYYIWVQFNDIPEGVEDDCAARWATGDWDGAANGEIFLSVSSTMLGLLWDKPRNLTNSYSSGCDSANGNGACDSDHWPAMAPFGTDYVHNAPTDGIVDPTPGTGTYGGSYYLPVQYIHDIDAGGIVQDEGTWQNSDVAWFQLACVDPEPSKLLSIVPTEITFPAWDKIGVTRCTTITFENNGNANLTANYSVTTTSHPGGILLGGSSSGAVAINAGFDNIVELQLCLGNGAVSGQANLSGEITFTAGDFDNGPIVFPIDFIFADTITFPFWDTVYADDGAKAANLALTVANSGNKGNQGIGRVNLDHFDYGDCDVYDPEIETDPYVGESRVYLYDGSKVICWDDGGTIECNVSIFGRSWAEGGFYPAPGFGPIGSLPGWVPVPDPDPGAPPISEMTLAEFWTRDTSILISEVTIAPEDASGQWMIQVTKFTNLTGGTLSGLRIGDAIDWDVPADSGSENNSGYESSKNLVYQTGSEYDQDDECIDNSRRYGGIAVLDQNLNGSFTGTFHNAYAMDNATQVYPTNDFVNDSLWKYMGPTMGGLTVADSTDNDLHMVATYQTDFDLGASDVLITYTLLVMGRNGEADFFAAVDAGKAYFNTYFKGGGPETCCIIRGDINHDGAGPDISDLVYLVTFMFQDGPLPPCEEPPGSGYFPEADVNGDAAGPDISDLVYLVTFMFQDGPELVPCPTK